MRKEFLVIDVETGGLDPKQYSLLSVAGIVWRPLNNEEKIKPLFDIKINEGKIITCADALKVNKIDLRTHCNDAFKPSDAVKFIKQKITESGLKRRVLCAGHCVHFDISFLERLYRLADYRIDEDFNTQYRFDSSNLMMWLYLSGKIDYEKPNSNNLFKLTATEPEEDKRHTAMGDALATAQALQKIWERKL